MSWSLPEPSCIITVRNEALKLAVSNCKLTKLDAASCEL